MELPIEIITGVREKQKAVEAAKKAEKKAASGSFEADRAYYRSEHPPGIRGDYLIPLCRLIESKLNIWPSFIRGDKKEFRRLEAAKEEKLDFWKQATNERERREKNLDDFIGQYLGSLDPAFKELLDRFVVINELLKAIDYFNSWFEDISRVIDYSGSEKDKSIFKHQLIELHDNFSSGVDKAVKPCLSAASLEGENDFKNSLQEAHRKLSSILESAIKPEATLAGYENISRLSDSSFGLRDLVWTYQESLDAKIRARIDSVKAECFKES